MEKKIGELLMEDGLIDAEKLQYALDVQKEKGGFLGKIMVDLGFVSEDDVASHLMDQGDNAYLPLSNYNIDRELIKTFPREVYSELGFLPVDKIGTIITIAVADDFEEESIEKIKSYVDKMDLKVFVTKITELDEAFKKYLGGN